MTYTQAIKAARKVGASKAEGLPLLANTIYALAGCHDIDPKLTYKAAMNRGLDAEALLDLVANDAIAFAYLQFDET